MLGFPKFGEDLAEWDRSKEDDKYSALSEMTAQARIKQSRNARTLFEEFFENVIKGDEIAKSAKLYKPFPLSTQTGQVLGSGQSYI